MDGTNVVQRAKSDAAVLLTHPTARDTDGEALPVLSVREVGAGRTMALTVDASWRWSLSEAAEGRGNQAYLRFWKNAIRWLMKDSTTARVTVDTPRENYAVGEDVRVVVRARDPGFAAMPDANVVVTIDNEGRKARAIGRHESRRRGRDQRSSRAIGDPSCRRRGEAKGSCRGHRIDRLRRDYP